VSREGSAKAMSEEVSSGSVEDTKIEHDTSRLPMRMHDKRTVKLLMRFNIIFT
jgi:hypothetical protein